MKKKNVVVNRRRRRRRRRRIRQDARYVQHMFNSGYRAAPIDLSLQAEGKL